MLVVYWEPEIGADSWYVTGWDRRHFHEIDQQIDAMLEGLMETRTRVTTITCPKCGVEIYSRARHDYHGCKCGTVVDGGFDYLRYGWPNGFDRPKTRIRYVNATRRELYDDWNTGTNKFGVIEKKGTKCPNLQN